MGVFSLGGKGAMRMVPSSCKGTKRAHFATEGLFISSSEMAVMLAATWEVLVVRVVGKRPGLAASRSMGLEVKISPICHDVGEGEGCQEL